MGAGAKVVRILTGRPTCRTDVITRTMRMHNSRVYISRPFLHPIVMIVHPCTYLRFSKHQIESTQLALSTRVEAATRTTYSLQFVLSLGRCRYRHLRVAILEIRGVEKSSALISRSTTR